MKRFLIKTDYDYADEFDVSGFRIVNEDVMKEITKKIDNEKNYPMTCSFGTNEELEFIDSDDVKHGLTITEISEEEEDIIVKLFGPGFGFVPSFEEFSQFEENSPFDKDAE